MSAEHGIQYDVVASNPELVGPELYRLWCENLTLCTTPQAHFQRLYRDAPEPTSTVFLLRAEASEPADVEIVGSNGFSVRRFQLGTKIEGRAAVSGDLVVAQGHRSLAPALRLVRAVREHAMNEFALCYGFPNDKAKGVMVRAGFHVLGMMTRYARVLRHATYLPRVAARLPAPPRLATIIHSAAHHPLVRGLAPLLDVARLASELPGIAHARARHRLAVLDEPDARFDELWARARSEYDVIGERTAAMLRWRYPRGTLAALVRSSDHALLAYALFELDDARTAHIRDVFGHKSALGPLFDLLLPTLWRRGAVSASIRMLGAPYLAAMVRARGFEPRPDQRTIVVQVGREHETLRARLEDAAAWHMLDLDEDT
ncbi:MAG TPA: hypothetical protein VF516_11605 [Kofleriaceae bacterium]